MANDLNQSAFIGDEIDLKEIFKILIESKKLIISTILIFTIAGIIYSLSLKPSFTTSTKLEIGYVELDNGDRELIESTSDLKSDLNVLRMKNPDNKFGQNVSIKAFEEKIIRLETTSSSAEQNEKILERYFNYIDERHSNLAVLITEQKKNQISHQIDVIQSDISFYKAKQLNENQSKKLTINLNLESIKSELSLIKAKQLNENQSKKLTINLNLESIKSELSLIKAKQLDINQLKRLGIKDRLAKLTNELPIIDLEISQLTKVIIDDTNNLALIKRNENIMTDRAASSPTLEQIIFSYKVQINNLNTKKYTNTLETERLNNQLKLLENDTLQSDELFTLEQEQKTLENQLKLLENDTLQSDELFTLEQEQKTLENQLKLLENDTLQSNELFTLEKEQKTFVNQLLILTSQNIIQTSPITDIETITIKPKTQPIIFMGIIFGFIAGIFLVFIINFIKSYRESEA